MISIAATHLLHSSTKAAFDNTCMNERGCVPVDFIYTNSGPWAIASLWFRDRKSVV